MSKLIYLIIIFLLLSCSHRVCKTGYLNAEKSRVLGCGKNNTITHFFVKSEKLNYVKKNDVHYYYVNELPLYNSETDFNEMIASIKLNYIVSMPVKLKFNKKKTYKVIIFK